MSERCGECGQALVEFCVFGLAAIVIWISTLHLSKTLLANTVAQSWSLFAARQALSKAASVRLEGDDLTGSMAVLKRSGVTDGVADVSLNGRRVKTQIHVPQRDSGGASFFNLLWSGLQSSPFSH